MPPRYPLLPGRAFLISVSALFKLHRSIHQDALAYASRSRPPMQVMGEEYIPAKGPCLVTPNHYSSPRFKGWWVVLSVNSAIKADVHWVVTAAWTYPGSPFGQRVISPLTRWAFQRLAHTYGFTTMPPMPPNPAETEARTESVRQVLQVVRDHPGVIIGLAPEGGDAPGGILHAPPAGVGRFISHLARDGRSIVPVGIYEDSRLCVSFGPAYRLEIPPGISAPERETQVTRQVMEAIARQLPEGLRGQFQG